MEFRWLVYEDHYTSWNNSANNYVTQKVKREPILQFWDKFKNKWITVPTVTQPRKKLD